MGTRTKRILLVLVGILALLSWLVVDRATSPRPLSPGTYADMEEIGGGPFYRDRVSRLEFALYDDIEDFGREPGSFADPDSRTAFAFEGKRLDWPAFVDRLFMDTTGTIVATVVVGDNARLKSIDLHVVKNGASYSPRRVR